MIARIVLAMLLGASALLAADSREGLEFEVNSALKERDAVALVRCFNYQGTDDATRKELTRAMEQILSWPSHYVTTSDRKEEGRVRITKNGANYTLNGDWLFQVHIYATKEQSNGYVFPAGLAGEQCLILMAVKER